MINSQYYFKSVLSNYYLSQLNDNEMRPNWKKFHNPMVPPPQPPKPEIKIPDYIAEMRAKREETTGVQPTEEAPYSVFSMRPKMPKTERIRYVCHFSDIFIKFLTLNNLEG